MSKASVTRWFPMLVQVNIVGRKINNRLNDAQELNQWRQPSSLYCFDGGLPIRLPNTGLFWDSKATAIFQTNAVLE